MSLKRSLEGAKDGASNAGRDRGIGEEEGVSAGIYKEIDHP